MRQALQSLFLLIVIFPNTSISEITSIKNYDEISENIFWSDLYPGGGWSLYCGFRFENQSNSIFLKSPLGHHFEMFPGNLQKT